VAPSERASAISVRRSAEAIDIVLTTRTTAASNAIRPGKVVASRPIRKSVPPSPMASPGEPTMPIPSVAAATSSRSAARSAPGSARNRI
jgi:hypothetical protein